MEKGLELCGVKFDNVVDFTDNNRVDVKVYRNEDYYEYKLGFITVNDESKNFVIKLDDYKVAQTLSDALMATSVMMEEDECSFEDSEDSYEDEDRHERYKKEAQEILSKYM